MLVVGLVSLMNGTAFGILIGRWACAVGYHGMERGKYRGTDFELFYMKKEVLSNTCTGQSSGLIWATVCVL